MVEMEPDAGRCDCKVGRSLDSYDLADLTDELARRWHADGDSVRELAEYVNERLLERALDEAGVEYLDAETATTYRLVTGAEVSDAVRVEKRRQLEREGVDVEALDDAFVSHQTLYRHLTDCLGVEYDAPETDPAAAALDQIRALQSRTGTVAEDRIGALGSGDGDDYSVLVEITATCERCGTHYEVGDLVEQGGCDCRSE